MDMFDDYSIRRFFYLLMKMVESFVGQISICRVLSISPPASEKSNSNLKIHRKRPRYVYPLERAKSFFSSSWVIENRSAVFEEGSRGLGFLFGLKRKKKSRRIGWQQQFVVDMGTSPPPWSMGKWTDPELLVHYQCIQQEKKGPIHFGSIVYVPKTC
jgi:hypothetical protein